MKSLNEFKEENLEKLLEYTTSNFDSENELRINRPKISPRVLKSIMPSVAKTAKAAEKSISLWKACEELIDIEGLTPRASQAIQGFMSSFNVLEEDTKDLQLKEVHLDNRFIFLSNKEMFKLNKRKNALI